MGAFLESIDPIGIAIVLITAFFFAAFYFFYPKESATAAWQYPNLTAWKDMPLQTKVRCVFLPKILLRATIICFALALIFPYCEKKQLPFQATYLIIDESSSMLRAPDYPFQPIYSTKEGINRFELMRAAMIQYIQEKQNALITNHDFIGLITFARAAKQLCALTWDYDSIVHHFKMLDVATSEKQSGTAMGYAIFKAASIMAISDRLHCDLTPDETTFFNAKNLIVITDGYPEPSPLDQNHPYRSMSVLEAVTYAKQQNICVYIINIDPNILSPEFETVRKELEQATNLTQGKLYIPSHPAELLRILRDIEMQKIQNTQQQKIGSTKEAIYPYFTLIGLLCLFLATVLNATWLHTEPQ